MFKYSGKCKCNKVVFSLELPTKLEEYSPRACDCDFCTQHNLSYLSHPKGNLSIDYQGEFTIIRQGSEQAKFLSCSSCGVIVGAVYQFKKELKGAVNANLLNDCKKLLPSSVISPKHLETAEKLVRWESLWLKVLIIGNSNL